MKTHRNSLLVHGLLALAVLAAALTPACKSKAAARISPGFGRRRHGQASGSVSGVSELAKEGETYIINYHLMIADMKDFDVVIGTDLAPKIAALYKAFPKLDKTTFTSRRAIRPIRRT